jgi:hypothetical protein
MWSVAASGMRTGSTAYSLHGNEQDDVWNVQTGHPEYPAHGSGARARTRVYTADQSHRGLSCITPRSYIKARYSSPQTGHSLVPSSVSATSWLPLAAELQAKLNFGAGLTSGFVSAGFASDASTPVPAFAWVADAATAPELAGAAGALAAAASLPNVKTGLAGAGAAAAADVAAVVAGATGRSA